MASDALARIWVHPEQQRTCAGYIPVQNTVFTAIGSRRVVHVVQGGGGCVREVEIRRLGAEEEGRVSGQGGPQHGRVEGPNEGALPTHEQGEEVHVIHRSVTGIPLAKAAAGQPRPTVVYIS